MYQIIDITKYWKIEIIKRNRKKKRKMQKNKLNLNLKEKRKLKKLLKMTWTLKKYNTLLFQMINKNQIQIKSDEIYKLLLNQY